MKYLLPAAAVLILGICVQVRRGEQEAIRIPERRVTPVLSEGAKAEPPRPSRKEQTREAGSEGPKAELKPAAVTVISISSQEMQFALRDELQLTEQQLERVTTALEARDKDLKDTHEAIRKSGVFVPGEYGKWLMRMKEGWFRNIDQVLDSRQHAKFEIMVAAGFLRPGTEFTADLNAMTIVNDR